MGELAVTWRLTTEPDLGEEPPQAPRWLGFSVHTACWGHGEGSDSALSATKSQFCLGTMPLPGNRAEMAVLFNAQ